LSERRAHVDAAGAAALIGFSALLGFNQVVIKIVNEALQPVAFAGLRSAAAFAVVALWLAVRGGGRPAGGWRLWPAGLLIGAVFSVEFLCLFLALDLTSVVRVSIMFYTMPVWLALAGHVLIPGERIGPAKLTGLVLALLGVAWALAGGRGAGEGRLAGDLLALGGALGWAGLALVLRLSALARVPAATQLLWQLGVSAPLLLALSAAFGPVITAPVGALHAAGFAFQVLAVASFGFLGWFRLLAIYPAAEVASFAFLAPVFGVGFGWLMLDEAVGAHHLGALALVALGIRLVNRPR